MVRHDSITGSPEAAWLHRPAQPLPGAAAGALQGLRFAVKDNMDVAAWPTTAACPAFSRQASAHASVVQRLLDAGASLVGKTNLDQFACGLNGTRSPYGPVPNAFDARYVSGGSSSGSAYVVASGQVDFALGTDTAGSGRVPAGLNNIVGLKPSKGLISAHGVLPAAQSVDCVSIFARTVPQAVQVLQAAMGYDPRDPYARPLALKTTPLPSRFRFGVPQPLVFHGDALAQAEFQAACQRLTDLGGSPVPVDYTPLAEAANLLYESALVAERYAAIREFFDAHAEQVMEPVRTIIARGRHYSAADWCAAMTRLHALGQQARALWEHMDVLLVPTAPTHYTIAAMQADPVVLNRNLGAYTNFVNLLDYAALSVPSSLRPDGLPFGITLIGPCASDLQLAELGQRYHQASGLSLGATGQPLPAPQPLPGLAPPAEPAASALSASPVPPALAGRPVEPTAPAVLATPAASAPPPDPARAGSTVRVAVVGAHLSGMPLNSQLTERGAWRVAATQTAPEYRLYALPDTTPPKPGLLRVAAGSGAAIAVEVWEMPLAHYGSFVALIPAPLGIGSLRLADGSQVQGFLCEPLALQNARDISDFGGWRAYIDSLAAS